MPQKPIEHIVSYCGNLKDDEHVLILCDSLTADLGKRFLEQAKKITPHAFLEESPLAKKHGEEPSPTASSKMLDADLIISLCTFSLAHSQARANASRNGARFLSLPFYSLSFLQNPAILFTYKQQAPLVRKISDLLSTGHTIRIQTALGTDLRMTITDRVGNYCPGFVENPGDLGSPPDIEANVAPIEHKTNGTIVVDGSVTCPEIGLLTTPIVLTIKDGIVHDIASTHPPYIEITKSLLEESTSKRRVLAEFGVGLNPKAELTGTMLTDEGSFGSVHFGFGSNYTIGGCNKTDFHLDFVVRNATIWVDSTKLFENGELVL